MHIQRSQGFARGGAIGVVLIFLFWSCGATVHTARDRVVDVATAPCEAVGILGPLRWVYVMSDPFKDRYINPRLCGLIESLRHRLVVIGSVARREPHPRDIDLLFDMDSARAEREIRDAIAHYDLRFDSCLMGQWTFSEDDYGVQVEILPVHRGPRYRTVVRNSSTGVAAGMTLRIARMEDAQA